MKNSDNQSKASNQSRYFFSLRSLILAMTQVSFAFIPALSFAAVHPFQTQRVEQRYNADGKTYQFSAQLTIRDLGEGSIHACQYYYSDLKLEAVTPDQSATHLTYAGVTQGDLQYILSALGFQAPLNPDRPTEQMLRYSLTAVPRHDKSKMSPLTRTNPNFTIKDFSVLTVNPCN